MSKPTYKELEKRIRDLEQAEALCKQAQEALRQSEEKFRTLIENIAVGIFRSTPDPKGWFLEVNTALVQMLGYENKGELLAKDVCEIYQSLEDRLRFCEKISKNGFVKHEEFNFRKKDGTPIVVSNTAMAVRNSNGEIVYFDGIVEDITERKRAEEELYVQKTYFEKLFNSAPEAIILHDNNDTIVNVNDEFTKMFGYPREEAIGKQINDLVASEEFKDDAAELSYKVVHGERVERDTKRKRKDGTLIDVWILGAPITHDGEQMGVYAIYRDITERKRAEEARMRLREEARMARNIQTNLLPRSNPDIPGYDIAGKNIAALNVGGDYFDFIWLDDHRLAIGLGDVSGKGLAASLVMTNLQGIIRGQAFFDVNARECLQRSNKLLYRSTDARTFVSLFYGVLDIVTHTFSYGNAGQNMPIIFPAGGEPIALKTRGIALGIKEDVTYEKEEMPINPGDRLLIYSDGISEAMNEQMEQFGDEKLREIVRCSSEDSSSELIEKIIAAVNAHVGDTSHNDDMTIIVLKRKGVTP
jgi:sigma-B regulation protein RsbU (phosphoserine phosphatase)